MRPTDGERAVSGAIVLVLLVATALVLLRLPGAGADHLVLQVSFPNAGQGLYDGSDVRIRGVPVGQVADIELDGSGRAIVTVEIDRPAPHLPASTVASIQPLSLFGPQYLALDPGEGTGPPLSSGATLVASSGPTELQSILGRTSLLLDAIDGEAIADLVASSATIARELAPRTERMLTAAGTLTDVAVRHLDDGTRILADLTRTGEALRGRADQFAAIGGQIHELVPELTARREAFGDLLVSMSRTATVVADLLEAHPDAVAELAGSILPTLVPPLAALVADIRAIPEFADALVVLFGELASIFHLTGPSGQLLGAIELQLGLDPCELVDLLGCHQGAGR